MAIKIPVKRSVASRLKEISDTGLASLVPHKKQKKEKEEVVPELREITTPAIASKIVRLCEEIDGYNDSLREVKKLKEDATQSLKILLESKSITEKKFKFEGGRVSRYKTKRSSVSVQRLLELRVQPETITAATITTESDVLRVYGEGVEEEEEE